MSLYCFFNNHITHIHTESENNFSVIDKLKYLELNKLG